MRKLTYMIVVIGIIWFFGATQPAEAQSTMAADETFVVEYYYKTKWGHADEFMQLFRKNHLPVLKEQVKSGRITRLQIEKPRYHATEDGRWDFRVTIVFKNAVVAFGPSPEEEIIKKLYPDQATFKKEEQRRFAILEAHWDIPLVTVPLE
jgi:hypothetical protein